MSAGVTYARGFRAAGITAGFKPSGHPDLALLIGDPGTTAAGLFTTNLVAAAPVHLTKRRVAQGRARSVVVNSGQANAATGRRGDEDANEATAATATTLGIDPAEVLQCSTGVIGEPLHLDVLVRALPALAGALSTEGGNDFARAIMTTDTVPKSAATDAGPYRVGGSAKGVGMISPNLATMLAFLTTDAPVAQQELRLLAAEQLLPRFDALTVDACTSTNDTVLLFASAAAGGEPVRPDSPAWDQLSEAVGAVGESLASQLIHDAEGVTRVMVVLVEGAATEAEARVVAKAVANSPLVKTAAFGQDPNPGRILQAVGSSGVVVDPGAIDVWIGETLLAEGGTIPPVYFEADDLRAAAKATMAATEFAIRVRLGDGPGASRALGCDLSYEYVRINGEYTT